jgi:hypothetical protein
MAETIPTQQWRRILFESATDATEARDALALRVQAARRDGLTLREIGAAIGMSYSTAKRMSETAR